MVNMKLKLKDDELFEFSETDGIFHIIDKFGREYFFTTSEKMNPSMLILLESDPEILYKQIDSLRDEIPHLRKIIDLALDFDTAYWENRALIWINSDLLLINDYTKQLTRLSATGKTQSIRHFARKIIKKSISN